MAILAMPSHQSPKFETLKGSHSAVELLPHQGVKFWQLQAVRRGAFFLMIPKTQVCRVEPDSLPHCLIRLSTGPIVIENWGLGPREPLRGCVVRMNLCLVGMCIPDFEARQLRSTSPTHAHIPSNTKKGGACPETRRDDRSYHVCYVAAMLLRGATLEATSAEKESKISKPLFASLYLVDTAALSVAHHGARLSRRPFWM